MREHVVRAGITERKYDKLVRRIEKRPFDYVARLYDWLHDIYMHQWSDVDAVWNSMHITPEMWAMYEQFGLHDLEECILLKKALKELKLAFKTVPKVKT